MRRHPWAELNVACYSLVSAFRKILFLFAKIGSEQRKKQKSTYFTKILFSLSSWTKPYMWPWACYFFASSQWRGQTNREKKKEEEGKGGKREERMRKTREPAWTVCCPPSTAKAQNRNIGTNSQATNFHIHACVLSDYLYILKIGLPILLILILGIYKSLTDTWMWTLGPRPRNSISGNT
jgi:hypothetical protein